MTLERWQTFSKHDQVLNIAAAIMRAAGWQDKDQDKFLMAIKEASSLLEITMQDPKWSSYSDALKYLKNELNKFKTGERQDNIKSLYEVL